LVPMSGEPNVTIMEAKALACNIVPGRLPRGPVFEEWLKKYVPADGPPNLHPEQPPARRADRRKIFAYSRHGGQNKMSGGLPEVAHASRVLASASSRGNGDFDSPTHRRQASPRRTVRLNACAPFLLASFAAS